MNIWLGFIFGVIIFSGKILTDIISSINQITTAQCGRSLRNKCSTEMKKSSGTHLLEKALLKRSTSSTTTRTKLVRGFLQNLISNILTTMGFGGSLLREWRNWLRYDFSWPTDIVVGILTGRRPRPHCIVCNKYAWPFRRVYSGGESTFRYLLVFCSVECRTFNAFSPINTKNSGATLFEAGKAGYK